jgi:hypothetical protein
VEGRGYGAVELMSVCSFGCTTTQVCAQGHVAEYAMSRGLKLDTSKAFA